MQGCRPQISATEILLLRSSSEDKKLHDYAPQGRLRVTELKVQNESRMAPSNINF